MKTQEERIAETNALRSARKLYKERGKDWWDITVQIIVVASDMSFDAISAADYTERMKIAAHEARWWLEGAGKQPSLEWGAK